MTPETQRRHDEIMYFLDKLDTALEKEYKEQRMFERTNHTLQRLTNAINLYFCTARSEMPFDRRYGSD